MNNHNTINKIRRKMTRFLTRNIGSSRAKHHGNPAINNVLICRPNGRLGNLLLITPLVQEIIAAYPECKIDLFVKGNLAPIIFENYHNVDRIIRLPGKPFKQLANYFQTWLSLREKEYDLVINIDSESSSGRLSAVFSKSEYAIFGDENYPQFSDQMHLAKHPVYSFREFNRSLKNKLSVPTLDINLTAAEISNGKKLLDEITNRSRKTIAVFTFATGNKMYPAQWWEDFYIELSRTFPDYNIVEILPLENVSQLGFKIPSFYSKDIREIAAFMANVDLFIGADSGMMHLASASKIPVAGLFAVTDLNKYQPYGNGSIGINTNETSITQIAALLKNKLEDDVPQKVISIHRPQTESLPLNTLQNLKKYSWML